mmetsp:Transcript_6604/g.11893  ORF Transcript_6604/g.11893 Transcript_6604/m.11893 type:complete len:191 (+) Transcript_6604:46-618(+)|eukprot:CAMPEP_0194569726 /NCGR_PEP_ID=MMETSP0292-20121207/7322_1 /TAXON_ID=39354 /ORGANISM="Heterosigma akashiwo, Strain CCMP2393" /LENGTH=190 /DNA_ID=CAMNT_0039420025 /DNA_START=42 /DNA_END=614 /DNA_ORIENTATION=-
MSDPYSSEDSRPPPLPNNYDIDLGGLAPVFGVQGSKPEPDYLNYNAGGRGLTEKMFCNAGIAYLAGTFLGGGYGLIEGARLASGKRFRLKVNSILNFGSKRGSRFGNALGVLGLMYTVCEHLYDSAEISETTSLDWLPPVAAGLTTGMLYKSTTGPKTAVLAGVIGAGLAGTTYAGNNFYESLGRRSSRR